jgi:MFS family permease
MPSSAALNAQRFLWFRILFNCRFYYPVYTIFFLDAGLSLAQFATLNFAWALSIVVLEVPSGALADQIGRRTLIVASAVLMVIEMACLAFLPIHAGGLTFAVFLINRIVSGAAEACASGADEALTYDSLPAEGREEAWAALQARLMRWSSLGGLVATLLGAFLYDAALVNRTLQAVGLPGGFSPQQTMKWPVLLCFFMALACLAVAVRFVTPESEKVPGKLNWGALRGAAAGIGKTLRWLMGQPMALALLAIGLLGDSFMRLFYTIGSQFYRVLEIPVGWYGVIGAVGALSGVWMAGLMPNLAKWAPAHRYALVGGLVFLGYLGLAFPLPIWGVWAVVPFWFGMRMLHFFLSGDFNRVVPPEQRATALSFRGLSMNLAYGVVTQAFGLQTAALAGRLNLDPKSESAQDQLFRSALPWWPWVFLSIAVVLGLWARRNLRGMALLTKSEFQG